MGMRDGHPIGIGEAAPREKTPFSAYDLDRGWNTERHVWTWRPDARIALTVLRFHLFRLCPWEQDGERRPLAHHAVHPHTATRLAHETINLSQS